MMKWNIILTSLYIWWRKGRSSRSYIVDGRIHKLLESKSLWRCLSCFACVERCPRGVEPAKIVEAIRLEVIRRQGENHLKPNQIPELLDEDLPQQAIVSAFRKYSK